jgi:hypothetical protein
MNLADLEKENQVLRSEVLSLRQAMSVSNRTIYIEKYNDLVKKYNNLLLNYKATKEKLNKYEKSENPVIAGNFNSNSGPTYTHLNKNPAPGYLELNINRPVKLMSDISIDEFRRYLIENSFSEKCYKNSDFSFHRWGKNVLVSRAIMNNRSVNGKGVISRSMQKKFGININFEKYKHVSHKNGDIKVNDLTVSDFTDIVRIYTLWCSTFSS